MLSILYIFQIRVARGVSQYQPILLAPTDLSLMEDVKIRSVNFDSPPMFDRNIVQALIFNFFIAFAFCDSLRVNKNLESCLKNGHPSLLILVILLCIDKGNLFTFFPIHIFSIGIRWAFHKFWSRSTRVSPTFEGSRLDK